METKEFKVRLSYTNEDDETVYIDELESDSELTGLRCEYNWLGEDSENRDNWERMEYGVSVKDFASEFKYEKGCMKITLIASDSFDRRITVLHDKKLTTRTLWDWIKIRLNGQLSDGIGENEVGEYKGYDVWLDDIVCEGEFLKDDSKYFLIPAPIQEIQLNQDEYDDFMMPGFTINQAKLYALLQNAHGDKRCEVYNKIENLQRKNIKYIVDKLNRIE